MTIAEPGTGDKGMAARIRRIFSAVPKDLLVVGIVVLAAGAGFGTGLLAGREGASKGDQLWIENLPAEEHPTTPMTKPASIPAQPAAAASAITPAGQGTYVASKTGSAYYLPTCSGAKRLKDENKVWFDTKAAAEAKGYQPAKGCAGI